MISCGMKIFWIIFLVVFSSNLSLQAQSVNPKVELRGAWIATVNNIDFPKKPSPNSVAQKEQWSKLVEKLKKIGINTLFVQVRPAADALYESAFVPWSAFLNGKQGTAPEPFYDPMQYMIEVAHQHGMEFHAWLNPYRATLSLDTLSLSPWHVFYKNRDWMVEYDSKFYINPGLPEARQHIVQVVEEIVRKYDLDGIHLDDYFYPYPVKGKVFQDSAAYQQYGEPYGSLGDWRRNNNNQLIEALAIAVKEKKPYIKFGVSPFGVWRNKEDDPLGSDTRAGVKSYDDLYADVLSWLQKGWLDYVAPQLYFNVGYPPADYEKLLNWWRTNSYDRNLLIGHAAYKVGDNPVEAWQNAGEIPKQIRMNRAASDVDGSVFFSTKSLLNNPLGVTDSLENYYYKYPALVPSLVQDDIQPVTPKLKKVKGKPEGVLIKWKLNKPAATKGFGLLPPDRYIIYRFAQEGSNDVNDPSNILAITDNNGAQKSYLDTTAEDGGIYTYAITAVNRFNNEGRLSNKILVRKNLGRVKKISVKAAAKRKKKKSNNSGL